MKIQFEVVRSNANSSFEIEVEVVNTWIYRIIGDLHLPEPDRHVKAHTVPWKVDTPLMPSGLIGPVQLISITVKSGAFSVSM